jgi:hypothetical protein
MAVAVAVCRLPSGDLQLHYRLQGEEQAYLLPAKRSTTMCDGLWQHTCCELFVAAGDAPAYREFNFSPSTCWAAYQFTDYRQRDTRWQPPLAPQIVVQRQPLAWEMVVSLPAELLPSPGPLQLGVTVVAETPAGEKNYWALQHAAAQPDFHLRSSFVLSLP